MTPNTAMLPSGAAAHALERGRLAQLRLSIADRIEADFALLDRLITDSAVPPLRTAVNEATAGGRA